MTDSRNHAVPAGEPMLDPALLLWTGVLLQALADARSVPGVNRAQARLFLRGGTSFSTRTGRRIRSLDMILAAIGIGSYLFHTHARVWALYADVIPIQLFILVYLCLATIRFFAAPWWAAPASSSPTGWPPSATPTRSWCWMKGGSSSAGPTRRSSGARDGTGSCSGGSSWRRNWRKWGKGET